MIDKNLLLLLLIVFLVYLKSVKIDNFNTRTPKIKIGIVSMVTKQKNFEYWLDYHLNVLKIDHVILRVENTDEYKELFKLYNNNRIIADFYNKEDIDTKHNYLTIMDRQKIHVNNGIDLAKQLNINYLFHIDADELIYVNGNLNEKDNLRLYLQSIPKIYQNIHLKNYEAVFPNMEDKCFNTKNLLIVKKENVYLMLMGNQ